jgi:hypothetical protein
MGDEQQSRHGLTVRRPPGGVETARRRALLAARRAAGSGCAARPFRRMPASRRPAPMIPRYARPEMSAIWSPETKFRIWFEIEAHACDAQAALGVIPKEARRRSGRRRTRPSTWRASTRSSAKPGMTSSPF